MNPADIKLPSKDERVFTSLQWAGFRAMQVCVLPDATDVEILAHCNKTNPQLVTNGWHSVIHTEEDCERLHIDKNAIPCACIDCPGRKHMIVVCI